MRGGGGEGDGKRSKVGVRKDFIEKERGWGYERIQLGYYIVTKRLVGKRG